MYAKYLESSSRGSDTDELIVYTEGEYVRTNPKATLWKFKVNLQEKGTCYSIITIARLFFLRAFPTAPLLSLQRGQQ